MSTSPDLANLLIGMTYLLSPSAHELRLLYFPDRSQVSVDKYLRRLHKDGIVEPMQWAKHDTDGKTRPQPARWLITAAGRELVRHLDPYPERVQKARHRKLIEHDARTIATIVQLILLGRNAGLRGVFVRYEVRLDPQRSRPVADALLSMQTSHGDCPPNSVPWSTDPVIQDECCWRFAIEGDNATEPPATIRGKGAAYDQLYTDREWTTYWQTRYGRLPTVLWVAPTDARATLIREQFASGYRHETFLVTTDAALVHNSWHWMTGRHATVGQIAITAPQQPALRIAAPRAEPPQLPAPAEVPTNSAAAEIVTETSVSAQPAKIAEAPKPTQASPPTLNLAAAEHELAEIRAAYGRMPPLPHHFHQPQRHRVVGRCELLPVVLICV